MPIPLPARLPRPRPRGRLVLRGSLAALALLVGAAASVVAPAAASAAPTRPFSATSPFNTAVPSRAKVDPASAAMVARASRDGLLYANLVEFGIPVYTAGAAAPSYDVSCSMEPEWGPCPLSRKPMRIPDGAVPQSGSDGAMVVVDSTDGSIGEYWQAWNEASRWGASYGAVNALSGSGWGGSSTGAGASRLGGVVRVAEIQAGVVEHALVLQSDNVCAKVYRAPALKTDGDSTRADCIPEGARLQLDPSLDLSRLTGLTRGERVVARAMQTYGAYVIDRGGAPLSVSFERAPDASEGDPGAVYRAAGLGWDYYGMPHVPWKRLRVLA